MADIPVKCSFTLTALRNSPFSVKTCTLPSSNTRRCPCVSQDTSIGFSSCPFARPRIPKHCRDRPELAEYIFILKNRYEENKYEPLYIACNFQCQLRRLPSHPRREQSHLGKTAPGCTPSHPLGGAVQYRQHMSHQCQEPALHQDYTSRHLTS